MSSLPLNSIQTRQSNALSDAISKRLNQLPLHNQQQVLDFVEFLLHHHKIDQAVQSFDDDLEEDLTVWEASTDEDWLALEAQLAAAKQ